MHNGFKTLRGLPFRPAVSAIGAEHEQRMQAWLSVQPPRVNRRKARRNILELARQRAQNTRTPFADGLETVIYQLECEAERAAAKAADVKVFDRALAADEIAREAARS